MKDFAQNGWKEVSLGEICEKTETVDPRKAPEDEFDYVDVSSVSNETFTIGETQRLLGADAPSRARRKIRSGDILFATIRPTLQRIAQVPECLDGQVCSTGYIVLRPMPALDARFLMHSLFRPDFMGAMESLQSGASYPAVTDKQVRAQTIPLPPLEEQQRIVAVLDEAFEGLARARAHAEANLKNARDLFDGQLSAIFRKIDNGQKKPLGDVCDFVRGPFGGSLKKAIFKPSGYAVYEQQHAIRDQFEDFRYFIDDTKFAEMARFRVEAGDLIMSCSGTMGKVAIVPEGAPDGIINQALLKLRPSEELRADFLKRWMQSDDFQDQLSANTMGVAIKNVASVKTLKTLSAMVPSLEEQDDIVCKSKEAEEQFTAITQSYEAKLEDLDDLRQSLLQKAFAGELT